MELVHKEKGTKLILTIDEGMPPDKVFEKIIVFLKLAGLKIDDYSITKIPQLPKGLKL